MDERLANRLPYYPSKKYLRKNWEPESLPIESLKSLAQAQALATKQGVLSPSLAAQMLPNAMVEGWDRFGVISGKMGYPPTPQRDDRFEKMGMRMVDKDAPKLIKKWSDVMRSPEGYEAIIRDNTVNDAKMAALILAEKARLYGEDKAVERWNGRGRAVEEYYGENVRADAPNHARKVEEAAAMLSDPANKAILDAYQAFLRGAK